MGPNKNLKLIQALRGLASLLVVLYHTSANSSEFLKTNFFFDVFSFGGAGVDIFFVLSGFIITYTSLAMMRKKNNFPMFLYRRVVRIFPVYWIIISLFLAAQIVLPSFYKTHFSFDIVNILSTYLLFPGHIMVNGVSWTLSYELFFYIVFSLSYLIPNKKVFFVLGCIYSLFIILLPLSGYTYKNENVWASLVTNPMNIEFFLGVLCVILIPFFPKKLSIPFVIGGSLLFVTGAIITNSNYELFPNSFNRVMLFGIPSFFIIIGVVKYELTKQVAVPRLLLTLGDASYSLYLLHLPLIAACCKLILLFNVSNTIYLHILLVTLIIIICLGSILFYKIFEKPIIKTLNTLKKIKVENEI